MKTIWLASFVVFYCLMATTGQAREKVIQESGTSEAPRTDANARSREELRRESRRRAKRLNRLSSLVSLWLKTVAVDLTQKPQTPLEKQVRKELTYELLDALRHSGELGAHRRGKKRELSGLEAKLLELFMEFEKLPFAAKKKRADRDLEKRYRKYLEGDSEHSREVRAVARRLQQQRDALVATKEETGAGYELRFFRRAVFLLSFLRRDIREEKVEITENQRRTLWGLPEEALRELKTIGALREQPSVSEEERENLDPFARAVLAYINEARDENPILQKIETGREKAELRDAYRSYVQTKRDSAEETAYKRVREILVGRVGEASRAEIAHRRAKLLLERIQFDVYQAHPDLKKAPAPVRRGMVLIRNTMRKLEEAGFFAGPDAFSLEDTQTNDVFAEAAAQYLSVAKENNPLLNLDRRIPRIQVFRIRRKYRKRWPEREKQAYEELKAIFLREIQRAQ
jgi:hypothetical protein